MWKVKIRAAKNYNGGEYTLFYDIYNSKKSEVKVRKRYRGKRINNSYICLPVSRIEMRIKIVSSSIKKPVKKPKQKIHTHNLLDFSIKIIIIEAAFTSYHDACIQTKNTTRV